MGRGKHCSAEERQIIKNLKTSGKTYREIAEIVNCSLKMVYSALKWVPKSEKRGRPLETSLQDERIIVRTVKKDPFITSTQIKKQLKLNVNTSTIRRRLIEAKLPGRSPRKVPLLSPKHIKARISFAEERVSWPKEKWRNILWSDETKINLFGSDKSRQYVRRPANQEYCPQYTIKTIKHGGGNIMVWGCFSYNGVGPIFRIRETMTQYIYLDIMKNVMFPYSEENMPLHYVFMQDNDPKHTAKHVKEWFLQNKVHLLPWPAQSPDLNPIENLWSDLKKAVGGSSPKNANELWELVEAAWMNIPVKRCQQLVDSMPKRCQAVLQNRGYTTKY